MKNLLVPVLGAVSIVSTGALAWLLANPPAMDGRTAKLESELQEARSAITRLKADLARKSEAQPSSTQLGATAPAADSTGQPDPAAVLASDPAAAQSQGNLREMLASPSMRALIDQQQAAQIELGYSRLFTQLQLAPEEKENLTNLLTARQKVLTDLSLRLMDPNLPADERQNLIAEARHQKGVYDESVRKFLNNDDDFRAFQGWEAVQPERSQFDAMGRGLFAASGEPLSPQQESQLFNLMAEVRTSPSSIGAIQDQTGTDPNNLTEEVIQQQLQQIESNNRVVASRAAEFLSPSQQQTLQTYLDQIMTMSRSSLNVSKMILKGN